MNAGLPGVGIGGLFYLLCALLMPFVELGRTFAGRSSAERWRSVAVQFVMALAMVATVTAVIWGVRMLFAPTEVVRTPVGGGAGGSGGAVVEHVVRVTPHLPIALVLLSYLLLGVVLLVATLLRYVVARRPVPVAPLQPVATTHFAPPPVPTAELKPSRV
jgi:hypothetical protein